MIGLVLSIVVFLVAMGICYKSQTKAIKFISGFFLMSASFHIIATSIQYIIEVDQNSYFTIQEISASIQNDTNPEATALKSMIKTSLADNKIMLIEFNQIGKTYSAYRSKYPLNH